MLPGTGKRSRPLISSCPIRFHRLVTVVSVSKQPRYPLPPHKRSLDSSSFSISVHTEPVTLLLGHFTLLGLVIQYTLCAAAPAAMTWTS